MCRRCRPRSGPTAVPEARSRSPGRPWGRHFRIIYQDVDAQMNGGAAVRPDAVIVGGLLVDGSGGPSRRADIGIAGDRIVAIAADLTMVEGARRIDAAGLVVAPGFIDVHSHSDLTLAIDPRAQSAVAQGVTTELVGNCGHGCAPIDRP